ncbi:hypothetical protein M707_25010 [Arthrobacter sp. AK-YN10]|nr:hypothetical protein M707_25010 [Arthrobacter sp. AK-YN10]
MAPGPAHRTALARHRARFRPPRRRGAHRIPRRGPHRGRGRTPSSQAPRRLVELCGRRQRPPQLPGRRLPAEHPCCRARPRQADRALREHIPRRRSVNHHA